MSESGAKKVFRMYTKHEERIKTEEQQFPPATMAFNANRDYSLSAAYQIQIRDDAFQPAFVYLVDNYGDGKAIQSIFVDFISDVNGDENNFIDRTQAQTSNDLIFGETGNDRLISAAGDDVVYGGQGRDDLELGEGNDSGFGGSGDER